MSARWDAGVCNPIADIRRAQSAHRTFVAREERFWLGGTSHPSRVLDVMSRVEETLCSVEAAEQDHEVARFFRMFARLADQTIGSIPRRAVSLLPAAPAGAVVLGYVDALVLVEGAPDQGTALTRSTWRGRAQYTPRARRREARRHGRPGKRVPAARPREEVAVHAAAEIPDDVRRRAALFVMQHREG